MVRLKGAGQGDADKDFLAAMIPHHQGAVEMAEVVLQHGKNPKIRQLAQEIITMQKKEIAETLKESTDPFIQKLLGDLEFRGRLSDKQWGILKGRADREKKKTAPKKPSGFVSNIPMLAL